MRCRVCVNVCVNVNELLAVVDGGFAGWLGSATDNPLPRGTLTTSMIERDDGCKFHANDHIWMAELNNENTVQGTVYANWCKSMQIYGDWGGWNNCFNLFNQDNIEFIMAAVGSVRPVAQPQFMQIYANLCKFMATMACKRLGCVHFSFILFFLRAGLTNWNVGSWSVGFGLPYFVHRMPECVHPMLRMQMICKWAASPQRRPSSISNRRFHYSSQFRFNHHIWIQLSPPLINLIN